MKLDKKLLKKLCRLVALRLNFKEKEALETHLQNVLSHFEQINSINTEGVNPLFSPLDQVMKLREDGAQDFSEKKNLLDGVPEKQGHLVKVPPTV